MSRLQRRVITAEVLEFLNQLKKNNNREWFHEHKTVFKPAQKCFRDFCEAIGSSMQGYDDLDKTKYFRIYRDLRFTADKTPFKPHFAASFSRIGARLRGGYYIRIRPGESFIACGFWSPNKEDLYRIRKEFEMDAAEFRGALESPAFKKVWGELKGEGVKTAPKGFIKEHPDIDLIRKKQFLFVRNFSDAQVLQPDFLDRVTESYRAIRPFFDLMSNILTTDLNGESLLDK